MKTKKIYTAALAVAIACGLAFQGEVFAATKESSDTALPYNGITYFDIGKTPQCVKAAAVSESATRKPYNGITYFDLGSQNIPVNGACTEESPIQNARLYNGITVF